MKLLPVFRAVAGVLLLASPLFTSRAVGVPAPNPKAAPRTAPKAAAKPAAAAASKPTGGGSDGEKKKKTEEKAKDAKPAAPSIHKVKRGEFELKVELNGIFEAARQTPISLTPKEWAEFVVVEAVPHGSRVKKGDVLVRLQTKKLEKQITELKQAAPLAGLNLKIARQEAETMERTTPPALDDARRAKMESEQDLAFFEDVDRAMQERGARESVKRMEQALSYSREELEQLEKMYKADDLTEETEEIILLRARNDVASYEWMLERTRKNSRRTLDTSIPRDHRARQRNAERTALAWRQAEQGLPEALRKKRLEVEAMERAANKATQRLGELEQDLAALTMRAPHDGIVYYGASDRGKWITASTVSRKLVPGGKLTAREVVLTLVNPAPLQIRVAVPEGKLRHLKNGLTGFAWPAWNEDAEFKTRLKTISFIPYADHSYDAVFTAPKPAADGPALYPGMNAKIRLDLYEAEKAITVPRKAVRKDAGGHYVHLKNGTKRKVKVGKANEKVYEILAGLKEGEEIKVP